MLCALTKQVKVVYSIICQTNKKLLTYAAAAAAAINYTNFILHILVKNTFFNRYAIIQLPQCIDP